MTDEIAIKVRKPGGWPKGKPRGMKKETVADAARRAEARAADGIPRPAKAPLTMLSKMKARPNWEGDEYFGVGEDYVDRLHIPRDTVDALFRDGIALQWITKSVRGMETPQELSKFTRGGWTPVHQSDFDGALDGMFLPKGKDDVIIVDDAMLVARPAEIQSKAKLMEKRESMRPVQVTEAQFKVGIPGVTGGDHVTARRGNMVNKTMERIEIPTSD